MMFFSVGNNIIISLAKSQFDKKKKTNINRSLASVNMIPAGSLELGELTATGFLRPETRRSRESPHYRPFCVLSQAKKLGPSTVVQKE